MITFQLGRTRGIGDGSEAFGQSAWDQRLEVLSFVMLPPNIVVLVPAVAIATIVAVCGGGRDRAWATALLRVTAGTAAVMFVVGALFLVSLVTRDERGPFELDDGYLRMGGMAMAAGMFVLCRAADLAGRSPNGT
jgi:hypothetical protein